MGRRILKYRPNMGTRVSVDESTGTILTGQDLEPTIEWNKHLRGEERNKKADGFVIGNVPTWLRWKWYHEWEAGPCNTISWLPYLVAKMQSPEWRDVVMATDMQVGRIYDNYNE